MDGLSKFKIYISINFKEKDEAKKKEAKWDSKSKKWYFEYSLSHFPDNDDLHTFGYKPYFIDIEDNKLRTEYFKVLNERRLKYLDIEDKKLRTEFFYLDEQRIKYLKKLVANEK